MTFLSSLFCCFNTDDSERTASQTGLSPQVSSAQTSLRRTLRQSHNPTGSGKVSYLNYERDITPKESEEQDHKGKKLDSRTKKKQQQQQQQQQKQQHPKKTIGKSPKTKNRRADNKDMDVTQAKAVGSGTNNEREDEMCEWKNQTVKEITDMKDSTDSSKDDDTLSERDEDEIKKDEAAKAQKDTIKQSERDDEGDVKMIEEEEDNPQLKADVEEMEEEEGGEYIPTDTSLVPPDLDLTKIKSDQAVTKSGWLLDVQPRKLKGRKTLVLDLDETLVHSSFKYVRHCDFVIPVEIENQIHNVYVIKRPGVDEFLRRCGELFEVVVFTASVSRYGDPVLDILDTHHSVHQRLFRESCYNYQGNYIKNLSQLGRPLEDIIIIDNSPASYIFHPQHSVPISSWFSDTHDCELTDLLPLLQDLASKNVDDVRLVLDVNI